MRPVLRAIALGLALAPGGIREAFGQGGGSGTAPAPLSAYQRRKVESLLRDQLPCLGCHTLNGEGGGVGPDLATVRERRPAEYIAAMLDDPEAVAPGSAMPRPMLPAATRDLLARYLATPAAPDPPAPPSPRPPAGADRSAPSLYARYCAACHGASGRGDGPNAARLPVPPAAHASRSAMSARPDDSLFDTIYGGGAIMNRSPRMPAYGATLSRAEIRSLVRHIRSLCGCEGPTWSRDGRAPDAVGHGAPGGTR